MKKQITDFSVAMQRLSAEFDSADPVNDGEAFDAAEAVVDRYERAVTTRRLDGFPTRDELGIACFWLSSLCGDPQKPHIEFAAKLLTPSYGMSLFECLPTVLAIREHALGALKKAVEGAEREEARCRIVISDDELPF